MSVLYRFIIQSYKDIEKDIPREKYQAICDFEIVSYSFDVGYDYWTTEQILYSVMPEGDAETPSSFTTTGHIGKKKNHSL